VDNGDYRKKRLTKPRRFWATGRQSEGENALYGRLGDRRRVSGGRPLAQVSEQSMAKGEVAQISLVLSDFPRFDFDGSRMVWRRCFVRGPAMDTRHSYYLHRRQDDFAELAADTSRLDFNDIPFIVPANDNLRTKERLSAGCGSLLRRLITLQGR
jgi:hypothetical protein